MSTKRKRRRRSRAPAVVERRPLLSLAMMVKDEEAFLAEALQSARGWVDEMIVVDTGSTDRTVQIAGDLGATVSHFEWRDDFSAARNETLRRSTGRYVLVLDADERFRGPHPELFRRLLRPGPDHPFEAWMLNVVNTRLDGQVISSFFGVRAFPNDPRLGYAGRIHNRFGSLDPEHPMVEATRYADLEVVHLGYDKEVYRARKKAERSLPLIEATLAEDPENTQYRFYLGREYLLLGRLDDAIAALEETVRRIRAAVAAGGPSGLLQEATWTLLDAYERADRPPGLSIDAATAALEIHPKHPDLWHALGAALLRGGAAAEGAECMVKAVAYLDDPAVYDGQASLVHRRWAATEPLGHALWKLQRFPEAYSAFLTTLEDKPPSSAGWPEMLTCLCALAIELGDAERLPDLLDRLLSRPDASPGMFFFEIERRFNAGDAAGARALLSSTRARHPRVTEAPEYAPWPSRLGLDT